ncbi:MAG: class I SAM-dependent methyltransferase [Alphaproteobacteria bacterium]|jgi:cephalosporin hydroxylase|nr:class I SAM-dependent methyltransferase [Alphaproteobacteria bacterium]
MPFSELNQRIQNKYRRLAGAVIDAPPHDPSDPWVHEKPAAYAGQMDRFFWENTGRAIDKWVHYLPIYERHFAPFRNSAVKVLEIGVQNGGSARMWRDWFGPEAVIFGIDINPACAAANGEVAQIRTGSQDDSAFLEQVVSEMGGVDIVIDDGSHVMAHIHSSFRTLYPRLSDGGVYLVEDLHCAYWKDFGGGYRAPSSFIETAKGLVDDMHAWYHGNGQLEAASANALGGVHFYDSVIVIDKKTMTPPRRALTGTEAVTDTFATGGTA